MDDRLLRLAADGAGLVLLADAKAAGITDASVRWAVGSGHLRRVAAAAFVPATEWDAAGARARHRWRVHAALARSPGTFAAAESAAVLWDLPLPGPPPERPVLLRPRTRARPETGQSRGATLRRAWLPEDETTRLGNLPLTSPARTWLDLSRQLDLPWSLAVADAVRRSTGLSAADLGQVVARHPNAAGHARSAAVATMSEHLVESPLESLCRGVQLRLGLPRPVVQAWIGEQRPEFRVDMLVRQYATVVEADGRVKYEGASAVAGQVWADKRRVDRLLDLGYDCHRFVRADVTRPTAWGRALLRTFARSQRRRGLPVPDFRFPWA